MPVPAEPLTGAFATVIDVCDEVVRIAPEVEAFVDGGRRITFAQWAEQSDALAGWMASEHGIGKGDVVAIQLPSSIDYAIAYQAALRLGAVASGVNPRLGSAEVAHIIERAAPKLTIDAPLDPAQLEGGDPLRRRVDADATDPVAIVWTGGTTGMPKGAWFDHTCMEAMTLGAKPLSQVGDRRISPLPFAHVGYMTRMWDELMHVMTTLIVPSPWTPAGALHQIHTERATVSQGVPTQYRLMLDHPDLATTDTSHLRIAGIGAARVPPELVTEIRERLGCQVVVRYASTETCLATGTRPDDDVDTICTTVGRPNGDVQLKIVDEGGDEVERGEIGTVCIRGRAMFRGYWNDPRRTADSIDADGWLHTGDLGWVGDDGNLRLAGRNTEMYIRGGYNVYPIEVENCIGTHPDVAANAIVGANVEDRLGEIGVLFVVPRPGRELELADLRAWVKEQLADYKAPDALVIVDELPLTSIGKVDKKALQPTANDEAARWHR
jgi:acyl-CoA synthetase (AMP-forming)/AMP-acid ligase II